MRIRDPVSGIRVYLSLLVVFVEDVVLDDELEASVFVESVFSVLSDFLSPAVLVPDEPPSLDDFFA